MASSGWCTIESDPAVFSELLQRFGVKGAAVEDVLCADAEVLAMLPQPVLGLVLLFKWKPKQEERNVIPDAEVYFAKQTVSDACATQALVNILLNNQGKGNVDLGQELTNFYEFTKELDPRMRGEMIGQSDLLRNAHNSFTRPSVFSFEDKKRRATEKDDTYHFVGYTFKDGVVWELDGLQDGPVFIEPAEEATWLATAGAAIQTRMQEISAQDTSGQGQGISFSLLAVTADRLGILEQQLEATKAAGQGVADVEQELAALRDERERHRVENQRRRHNYIPALVELFRALQEKGALRGIIDAHKETAAQALAKKKNRTEGQ